MTGHNSPQIEPLLTAARTHALNQQWAKACENYLHVLKVDETNKTALESLYQIALGVGNTLASTSLKTKLEELPAKSAQTEVAVKSTGLEIRRFGDDSCGWNCLPALLNKDSIIYCIGCGENIKFDLDLQQQLGCLIYAFDPTPKSLAYMRGLNLPATYKISDYGLADFDGTTQFNPPVDESHVSHTIGARPATAHRAITVQMRRLSTIMAELKHTSVDLLKIDIEGAEYGVINDIINSGVRPTQLLVEFHHFMDNWSVDHTLKAIISLSNAGYSLFSVHGHTDYCFVLNSALNT